MTLDRDAGSATAIGGLGAGGLQTGRTGGAAQQSGNGQQIDIGILNTHVAWLANQGMNYLAMGEDPRRLGNEHPNIVPYQVFATTDGRVVPAIGNPPISKRFCDNFGLAEMAVDVRFATNSTRVANQDKVTAMLSPVLAGQPTSWWVDRLEALKIGCGPINTPAQVFDDGQVAARGMVVTMAHLSTLERVRVVANPVRLSAIPRGLPVAAADARPACRRGAGREPRTRCGRTGRAAGTRYWLMEAAGRPRGSVYGLRSGPSLKKSCLKASTSGHPVCRRLPKGSALW